MKAIKATGTIDENGKLYLDRSLTGDRKERDLDCMCIDIEKIAETDTDVDYRFSCDVYEPDPGSRKNRWKKVGQNQGVLRISKATGETVLIAAMPEDKNNRRYISAAAHIIRHWQKQEFPDKTLFSCG